MTIRRVVGTLFGILVVIALAAALLIRLAALNHGALVESQRRRFLSYQLADELRRSSDDLTRFARTYVATGDPRFEQYYRDVLAIRNGEKPRPEQYERIYWDFTVDEGRPARPDGAPAALARLMQDAGATQAELAKLRAAQAESDALVGIEETALHAMKGRFRDESGAFTKSGAPDQAMAIRLMHDAAYHHEKARIMAPIDEFLTMLDARTSSELETLNHGNAIYLGVVGLLLLALLGVVAVGYPILRVRVLTPVTALQRQTRTVETDLRSLATAATAIAQGDLRPEFAVTAAPIRSARRDEIGDLSRVHDSMIHELRETGAAIAAMTGKLVQKNADLNAHVTHMKDAQKALEEAMHAAEAATRAKTEFLANMSHEIRTPLNAILGYAQLLRTDRSLGGEQRRKLDVIKSSGDHLLHLLNEVLDMSRIESRRAALVAQPFDLRNLLEQVRAMFADGLAARGVAMELRPADGPVQWIEGDAGRVRQVLINVVGNAAKFVERGHVRMTVRSETFASGQDRITIEIEDTGPGIAPDDRERIFGAFSQGASGAQKGGTGLGLTISRNLARMMGGDLIVSGAIGQGSTFTFTFVAAPAAIDAARKNVEWVPQRVAPAEARRKVLVVDDIATNRDLLQEELSRAGFEIRTAASGEDAITVHDAWRPDLILMDIRMPGMGGVAAIRQLRAAGSPVVIIVVTASVDQSEEKDVLAVGAQALLRKPCPVAELFAAIAETTGMKFEDVVRSTTGPPAAPGLPLRREDVPLELLEPLRAAAREARPARVAELARRVEESAPQAAQAIRALANDFRYDDLLQALGGATGGKT